MVVIERKQIKVYRPVQLHQPRETILPFLYPRKAVYTPYLPLPFFIIEISWNFSPSKANFFHSYHASAMSSLQQGIVSSVSFFAYTLGLRVTDYHLLASLFCIKREYSSLIEFLPIFLSN